MTGATDAVERELKLTVESDEALDALASAAALGEGLPLGAARRVAIGDTYYDTPDLALLRAGWSLRIRRGVDEPVATLKALAPATGLVHARREIEGPMVDAPAGPSLRPAHLPAAHAALVGSLAGAKARLAPIARLDQVRVVRPARAAPEGPEVATLSLDRVAVRHPAAPPSGDDAPVTAFRAVELEALAGAEPAAYDRLVAALAGRAGGTPETGGKLERALAALAEHAPGEPVAQVGVRADQPMAEAGRLVWRRQLLAMALSEASARAGVDIEGVHDMRVATRRARSAELVFGAFWAPEAIGTIRSGLKRTARVLGAVRDLDVALDDLATQRAALPADEAADLAPLAEHWSAARERARAELMAWLDGGKYRRFVRAMAAFTATPGAGARAAPPGPAVTPSEVRHVLPARIVAAYGAVRAYETRLADPAVPVATLHALRIDAKRLRYLLEPVPHLLGPDGAAAIKLLKRLQDHLGRMNDAYVAGVRLRAAQAAGVDTPAVARYLAAQDAWLAERVATIHEAWEPFAAPEVRAALFAAVAGW